MATLPGMRADVYFGEPDAPLPDWRKAPPESDSDAPPTPAERKALESMLGFDPAELEEEEEPRRHRRRGKPKRHDARPLRYGYVGGIWHGPKPPGDASHWTPIEPGPRGGKRWKRTGDLRQPKQTGEGGGSRPEPEPRARKQTPLQQKKVAARETLKEIVASIKADQVLGENEKRALADALPHLTVAELAELKRAMKAGRAAKVKAQYVTAILDKLHAEPAPKPAPEPDTETSIDPSQPIGQRIASYRRGEQKLAAVQAIHNEIERWRAEERRLTAEADAIHAHVRTTKTKRMTPNQKKRLEELYRQSGEANQRLYQAQRQVGARVREILLAREPVTIAYRIEEPNGLPFNAVAKQSIKDAHEWLGGIVEVGPGGLGTVTSKVEPLTPLIDRNRAHYQAAGKAVRMPMEPEFPFTATVIHEYGHHLEDEIPGVHQACVDFLKHRIGNEPVRRYKEIMPRSGYEDDEEGAQDQFADAFGSSGWYVGKIYKGRATEILSMGVQKLYEDPLRLATADPEYFKFVVGILDGSLRDAK